MGRMKRPAGLSARVRGRGLLLSMLEKEVLLSKIKVFPDGGFVAETSDWDSYWKPVLELNRSELDDGLDALHSAWRDYVGSGCRTSVRQEFCLRYFSLLYVFLSKCRNEATLQREANALRALLGFECFGISSSTHPREIHGAGICTLRNPCYLLAKLRTPDVLDDPQFLPLVTVACAEAPELFYSYRQYTLSHDSHMSLLFYLSTSEVNRSASFRLVNHLASGISYGIDPRTLERARRLSRGVMLPIIQSRKPTHGTSVGLELVDIGAGSGSLVSSLCREVQTLVGSMGLHPKFRLWFVDLEPADPVRFFRHKRFRGMVDTLAFVGDDYASWLCKPEPVPAARYLRVALVSRLFNNLSAFSIRCLSGEDLRQWPGMPAVSADSQAYLPSRCLASSGGGPRSLMVSNRRIALQSGRTFPQLSLSDFYRGLCLLSAPNTEAYKNGVFLPIRKTNPRCLVAPDGRSVISRIAELCDYLVIEDADVRTEDLVEHAVTFGLRAIAIQDVTRALGLTANNAYVVWPRNATSQPQLPGERIW